MYALSGYHSIRTTAVEYAVGEWAYYVFRITRVRTSEAPRPPGLSRNIYRTPHNATLRRPRVSCTHFSPARRYVAFAGSKRAGSPGGSDAGLLPPASLIRRGGEEQDIQTGESRPMGAAGELPRAGGSSEDRRCDRKNLPRGAQRRGHGGPGTGLGSYPQLLKPPGPKTHVHVSCVHVGM